MFVNQAIVYSRRKDRDCTTGGGEEIVECRSAMLSYVGAGILALEHEAALPVFSGVSAFATHCVLGDYDHFKDANSSACNRSACGEDRGMPHIWIEVLDSTVQATTPA
jgi:hypothetical protein